MATVSNARFSHLTDELFKTPDGKIFSGEFIKDEVLYRVKDGLLDGGEDPAVICGSHVEYYSKGKLHRDPGYAVLDLCGEYAETWHNGVRIE